jgi:hypothetical protein
MVHRADDANVLREAPKTLPPWFSVALRVLRVEKQSRKPHRWLRQRCR